MVGDAAQEDEGMAHIEQEVVTEQEAAELMAADEGAGDVRGAMVVPSDEVPTETSQNSDTGADAEFDCGICGQGEDPPHEGEARRPRLPADPGRPTQREVDEHEVCHIPFRSWCPYCIKGKAVSSPHKGSAYREEGLKITGVPTISLDYCWADGEDDEAERKESSPVLIIYIDLIDSLYAIPVKKKEIGRAHV